MSFARLRLDRVRLDWELRAWRRAGRAARLWWRDDDARGATRPLLRLLALSDRHATPLALAVIPNRRITEVVRAVVFRPQVVLVQHGVDHVNRNDGEIAGEFPATWGRAELVARLQAGWAMLAGLPQSLKVFAPPWNDVHPQLPTALAAAGYAACSAWGEVVAGGEPPRLDAHLDLLRWRPGARFRGRRRFLCDLRRALRARRITGQWDAPIGLLTHHLDHDEAAWAFLDKFLAWSSAEPALSWVGLQNLLPPARARPPRARLATLRSA